MNSRDQFGHYLLLKKLTEDALGETFRGGKIGRQALERYLAHMEALIRATRER